MKIKYTILLLALLFPVKAFGQATLVPGQVCTSTANPSTCSLTGVGAGHFIVLMAGPYNGQQSGPTDTFGLVWTSIDLCNAAIGGPSNSFRIIYWAVTGAHSGSDTFTEQANGGSNSMVVAEFKNVATVSPLDGHNCSTSTSSFTGTVTSGNFTTTVNNDLIIGYMECAGCTPSAGAGFTNFGAAPGTDGEYLTTNTAGTNTVSFSISGSTGRIVTGAAFKSTSAAPSGFPMVIRYREVPRRKIPWDDRRRKLEIVRI